MPPPTGRVSIPGGYDEPVGGRGGGGSGGGTWNFSDDDRDGWLVKTVLSIVGEIYIDDPVTPNSLMIGPSIMDSSGIRLFNNGIPTIYMDNDGDAFFGANLDDPAFTSLLVFSNSQTYNDEELEEGDVLIGDNSTSRANMLWDRSAGKLQFRGGTTMAVEIGTDGSLLAGAGNLVVSADGITFANTTQWSTSTTIAWKDSASTVAELQSYLNGGVPNINMQVNRTRDYAKASKIIMAAVGETDTTDDVEITMTASEAAGVPGIVLHVAGNGGPLEMSPTLNSFNKDGANIDFRVGGDNNANLLSLDAGTDTVSIDGFFGFAGRSELTVATGVVTATRSYHLIDTQDDDATDDLVTINGGVLGDRLVLQSIDSGRDTTLKDGSGNLRLAGDFVLDNIEDRIELIHDGSNWHELSRSSNA